jgi:hypothetical protein
MPAYVPDRVVLQRLLASEHVVYTHSYSHLGMTQRATKAVGIFMRCQALHGKDLHISFETSAIDSLVRKWQLYRPSYSIRFPLSMLSSVPPRPHASTVCLLLAATLLRSQGG